MDDADKSLWVAVLRDDADGVRRAVEGGASLDVRVAKLQVECAATFPRELEEKHGPRSEEEQAKTWELLLSTWNRTPLDVEPKRDDDRTPLIAALLYDRTQAVHAFLVAGADPNLALESGLTPLLVAVRKGDLASSEALLAAGADPNRAMPFVTHHTQGHSPLVRASGDGNLALVKLLLDHGADVNGRDGANRTALLAACARPELSHLWTDMSERREMTEAFEAPTPPPTCENLREWVAQERAKRVGDWEEIVALLLARGADAEAETPASRDGISVSFMIEGTPLLLASRGGDLEIVERLLSAGAEPRRFAGTTPLHLAIGCWGDTRILERLIAAGASVSEEDYDGRTPLDTAVRMGEVEAIPILTDAGADLFARNLKSGATLLHLAAAHGQTETAGYLLDRGLEINAVCAPKSPAQRVEEQRKRRALAAEILPEDFLPTLPEAPSPVQTSDVTPLMLAAKANKPETVALLLERGANSKARDSEGKSARDYAGATQKSEEKQRAFLASQPPHLENPQMKETLAMFRDEAERDALVKNLEAMQKRFAESMSGMVDGRRAAREATLALLPE